MHSELHKIVDDIMLLSFSLTVLNHSYVFSLSFRTKVFLLIYHKKAVNHKYISYKINFKLSKLVLSKYYLFISAVFIYTIY